MAKSIERIYTKSKTASHAPHASVSNRAAVFSWGLAGLALFGASLLFSGLLALRGAAEREFAAQSARYKWIVLVEGSQVDIDEVGRAIKQLDGVNEVKFVSAAESLNRLQNDPFLKVDSMDLDENALSASWEATWLSTKLNLLTQKDMLAEIRAMPGVLDAAVNENVLETMISVRHHWLGIRLMLGIMLTVAVMIGILIGLRCLFFATLFRFQPATFGWTTLFAAGVWALGAVFAQMGLGPVPAATYAMGVLFGGLWASWRAAQ